jgi:hypothetical protein
VLMGGGAFRYTAPEILQNKPYTEVVDCWSIGVISYILLGGNMPFDDDDAVSARGARFVAACRRGGDSGACVLQRQSKRGQYNFDDPQWMHVSDDAKDLIRGLLTLDPSRRLSARAALSHRWMRANDRVLAERDLGETQKRIVKFNTRRKFKAAVDAVGILCLTGRGWSGLVSLLESGGRLWWPTGSRTGVRLEKMTVLRLRRVQGRARVPVAECLHALGAGVCKLSCALYRGNTLTVSRLAFWLGARLPKKTEREAGSFSVATCSSTGAGWLRCVLRVILL